MSKAASVIFSHWDHLFEGLESSPQQYYSLVEQAILRRELPDTKISRITWSEGGILSAKREYLRVKRKGHVFDICGAPFGRGFFFSWWLGELPTGCLNFLIELPFIGKPLGWLLQNFLQPITYYKIDTALMFQESVHAAVLEVIDQITNERGLRGLSVAERKPVMKEFFSQL